MARHGKDTTPEVPAGIDAEKPTEVPPKGWLQILKRAFKEGGTDNVSIISQGVAYSAFTALVPALTAIIAIYGLLVSPARAKKQVLNATVSLPTSARTTISTLVLHLTKTGSGALTFSLVISILLALYSASGAVNTLITAVNIAYDETNNRSFVKKKLIAYGLTVGAIVFFVLVLGIVAVLPVVLKHVSIPGGAGLATQIGSVLLLLLLFLVATAVLYRVGPDRAAPKLVWASPGALFAAVVWVLVSVALGLYVRYGHFGSSFGPFAGVIILLFWLYLTAYVILMGAEVNSEAELQTARDTTTGDELPMGQRAAQKADRLPPGTAQAFAAQSGRRGVASRTGAGDGTAGLGGGSAGHAEHTSGKVDTGQNGRRGAGMSSDPGSGSHAVTTAQSTTNASTGDLVKAMTEQMSTLVRSEIQLAQAEVKEKGKKLGVGAGLLGGAGGVALYAVNALIATIIIVLDLFLPLWLAALIVTVVLFAIAGVLGLLGKKEVQQGAPPVPQEAIASTKKDVATVKEAAHR